MTPDLEGVLRDARRLRRKEERRKHRRIQRQLRQVRAHIEERIAAGARLGGRTAEEWRAMLAVKIRPFVEARR